MSNELRHLTLRLAKHENEYISYDSIRVFCGTFNVNGKFPDEDLRSWLFINENQVDLYAIGLQEVVDLNTTSFLLQSDWIEREQRWIECFNNELNIDNNEFNNRYIFGKKKKEKKNYKLISKYRMFGLLLLIYAKNDMCISEIFTSSVPTGIMDTVGNKGSVGTSFKINETRVCFVCSHFASDTDKLHKRNNDYKSTKQRLKFEYNANLDYYDLDAHDAIFWFGDLNYRIDKLSLNKTMEQIYTNELDKLIENDQLTIERNKFNVFEDYNEGRINFRPTYKFLIKQDIYEKQAQIKASNQSNSNENDISNLKIKLPSWTDRVLWKALNAKVNLIQYSSINTITISDHKPVYALFDMDIKKLDEEKFNKLYDKLLKETDKQYNEEMPHISIESFEFNFENCMFYDQKVFHLSVTNDGKTRTNIDVQFHDPNVIIVRKNDLSDICHSNQFLYKLNQWVKINPLHKERVDSGKSYNIELTTNFSNNILKRFNQNQRIEDFIIIRCLNGNDVFFTVSCDYKRTIIGFSLKSLSTLNSSKNKDDNDLKKEISFDDCNKTELIETTEKEIESFETKTNELWSSTLKKISIEKEFKRAQNTIEKLTIKKEKKN